ncbi:MAG: PfkB family carbohydrate kinase [Patescibacteria group bacterium]
MLIITGSLAYDYIMDFPGSFSDHILPDQIHNINLSFIVNKFAKRRGGTAGNASYALALLQTKHTLFSCAGKDFEEYQKDFEKIGIETKYIQIYKDTYTSTGFAMTDKKDNQIWGFFNGATDHNYELKIKTVATSNDLVLIGPQSAKGSLSLIKQCIKQDIPYMFDPGFILTQVSDEDLTLGVTHATYIIGNDYEIKLISDRVKDFKTLTKEKIIITTLGEKGAVITDQGKHITINPAKAKKIVDPSGAGDAWRGGFLAGLSRGFGLQVCGQMGAIAAVYAVEEYGTQEYSYTKSQFTKRYKETYNEFLTL